MSYYIYSITNITGDVIYVGCTTDPEQRLKSHRLHLAQEYGAISMDILEISNEQETAKIIERAWIKEMADRGMPLINRVNNKSNTTRHYPTNFNTVKFYPETVRNLKMLAALTNSKMAETADRAIRAALRFEQDDILVQREVEHQKRLNETGGAEAPPTG